MTITEFTDWLKSHDRSLDEISVWAMFITFGVLSLVKLRTFLAIYRQRDQTAVGRALKGQKFWEAVAFAGMSMLYGLTLYGYYGGVSFGFWERLGVRFIVVVGLCAAAVSDLVFDWAFRREGWGKPRERSPT